MFLAHNLYEKTYHRPGCLQASLKWSFVIASFLILFHLQGDESGAVNTWTLSAFKKGTELEPSALLVGGQETQVWQTSPDNPVLTFRTAGSSPAPVSGVLYCK